jgi:molybdopterin synthase sulfur carrier subunit
MKVKVQLYALLAKYLPTNAHNKTAVLEVAEGTSVQEVLNELTIPENMPKILLVNGRNAELDRVLAEGDTVSVFPPIAGGGESRESRVMSRESRVMSREYIIQRQACLIKMDLFTTGDDGYGEKRS